MVEHTHSTGGAVHSHTPGTPLPPYSERIPAAIKHAKELLDVEGVPRGVFIPNGNPDGSITATEAALAEALWKTVLEGGDPECTGGGHIVGSGCWACDALIAFTEKAEKLT